MSGLLELVEEERWGRLGLETTFVFGAVRPLEFPVGPFSVPLGMDR